MLFFTHVLYASDGSLRQLWISILTLYLLRYVFLTCDSLLFCFGRFVVVFSDGIYVSISGLDCVQGIDMVWFYNLGHFAHTI